MRFTNFIVRGYRLTHLGDFAQVPAYQSKTEEKKRWIENGIVLIADTLT